MGLTVVPKHLLRSLVNLTKAGELEMCSTLVLILRDDTILQVKASLLRWHASDVTCSNSSAWSKIAYGHAFIYFPVKLSVDGHQGCNLQTVLHGFWYIWHLLHLLELGVIKSKHCVIPFLGYASWG